ncbi:hypothetical protein [Candidatus Uabimicrobium amorphum]|uniref:Uncharacterized protein n=1 Tax=Uabimicrobium amorphum TaxID=2596890 RepID=A0A5S9F5A6_UABAM|nr:hypothetical protein [Candidatus Uabimicrobium amorphum]BBM86645.1 hypothetical protein UABAM_05031 [Candidatus Uabimicrobium amorphum]
MSQGQSKKDDQQKLIQEQKSKIKEQERVISDLTNKLEKTKKIFLLLLCVTLMTIAMFIHKDYQHKQELKEILSKMGEKD